MFDTLSSLNAALRASPYFGTNGNAPAPALTGQAADFARGMADAKAKGDALAGRLRGDFEDAKAFGNALFRAARQAAATAIDTLQGMGASADTLNRLMDDLQKRLAADASAQAFDAPRVPMGFAAGERVSFSLEIESLSVSASSDGKSFSLNYTRVSLSVVSERYIAGQGASADQLANFFDAGKALALPKPDDDDPMRMVLNLFAPLDKNAAKDPFKLFV